MSIGKREELKRAIVSLETQRFILGDSVVDTAVSAIEKQLADLETLDKPQEQRKQITIVDIAVSAIEKQLADLETLDKPQEQRKQITILFSDVVGSTNIGERLDPEELLELFDNSLRQSGEMVEAYGGVVGRFMGDGMLAFFGSEKAQENDPELAIRAGLAIVARAKEYALEVKKRWGIDNFAVRVGINTGLVVMGEVGGSGRPDYTAMGDATNLAARLESAAPAGGVLISHGTYRHVRGIFDVEPQDPLTVKGKSGPLQVYVVRRAKPRALPMSTQGVEGIETKTIGRERELCRLQEAYKTAVDQRETTIITLVGDAGVGKSRLLYEFENWIELRPELIGYLKGRAFQQTQGIPHFLLKDMLATRFQILESDSLQTVRRKFINELAEVLPEDGEMKAHILGTWLGYDFSDSPHLQPIKDDPEQIKNRATLYLTQFLTAISNKQPVVILLEDIHWADKGSLDAVFDLVRRQPQLPLLIICLARPSLYERHPQWGKSLKGVARLDVAPLSDEDTRALVEEILHQVETLPRLLIDLVGSRAEGNPFYAEELIKMLIDDGIIVTGGEKWHVTEEKLLGLEVPTTLTGVLQARLDSLNRNERQVIQQASVIGRTFWDKALAEFPGDGQTALPALSARGFIYFQAGTAFAGTAEYVFKHALLRDVIYETVLKRLRHLYHELVADWLVVAAQSNGRIDEYSSVIGKHFELANNRKKAAIWYDRAGNQAAATFSYEEAIHYLTLALRFTDEDDIAARFAYLQTREKAYDMQGNRTAQHEDLDSLTLLANKLGSTEQVTIALRRINYAISTSNYSDATSAAQEVINLTQTIVAATLVTEAEGHELWGYALWRLGQFQEAQKRLETSLNLAEEIGNNECIAKCLNSLGNLSGIQGNDATARKYFSDALSIWRDLGDRRGESVVLGNLGIIAEHQQDYAKAQAHHEQALTIKREVGDRKGEAAILLNLGSLALKQGNYVRARINYEQSLAIQRQIDDRQGEATSLTGLGVVVYEQGKDAEARLFHEESLAIKRAVGDRFGEMASLYNIGAVAMNQEDYVTAQGYFEQSLVICNEIGNRYAEGINLNELGAVALAQADFQLAESHYHQALAIRQEMNQTHHCVEDWAGLAQVNLSLGNRKRAYHYSEKILNYLNENPHLHGAEYRLRAFRFIWEALISLDQNSEADRVLTQAAQIIGDYLAKNEEPDLQATYLSQPHHRVLWEAWERKRKDRI